MLDNFNQPKGSTIGVLKDGRTIQEVIDELGTKYSYVVPSDVHGAHAVDCTYPVPVRR